MPRLANRRPLLLLSLVGALATGAAPASAHHLGHHGQGHGGADGAAAARKAPAGGSAAPDASRSAGVAATTAPVPTPEPMIVVGTPERPIFLRGVRGPLLDPPAPIVVSPAEFAAKEPVAARAAVLTQAQATKKLSKSCQKLVKITASKAIARLSKADKKKRTKCLEQRRKLIADSKKPASGPADNPVPGSTPAPGTAPGATPAPGSTPAPGTTPTPVPTSADPTPAPTENPVPTPTPEPCVPAGQSIGVVGYDLTSPLTVTRGCANAGDVTFTFTNSDAKYKMPHNLWLGRPKANGQQDRNQPQIAIQQGNLAYGQTVSKTLVGLQPGKYVLVCNIGGHERMVVPFEIF